MTVEAMKHVRNVSANEPGGIVKLIKKMDKQIIDVHSILGFYSVDVGGDVDIPEVHAVSIFRAKV
jgi:hypothetical protein